MKYRQQLWMTGFLLSCMIKPALAQILVVTDDHYGIPFGKPLQVEATGVLENDTLDGEPAGENGATAELISNTAHGLLQCPYGNRLLHMVPNAHGNLLFSEEPRPSLGN